jgi:hypothetical protein
MHYTQHGVLCKRGWTLEQSAFGSLLGICPGLTNKYLAFALSMNIGIFIQLLSGLDVFQISRLHKAVNVVGNYAKPSCGVGLTKQNLPAFPRPFA